MSQHTVTAPHTRTTIARRPLSLRSILVVAGPLIVLASELAAPRQPDGLSGREEAAFLLEHQERYFVSGLLGLLAALVLVVAFTTLAQNLVGRGQTLTRVGAVLGIVGATGLAMHMTLTLGGRDVLLDDSGAYAATDAAATGLTAVIAVISLIFGMNLAMVVLGVAARRAGLAGWWVVLAGALALVADFSPTSYNTVLWCLPATAVMAVFARHAVRTCV